MGVWIEIYPEMFELYDNVVTPLVGVWIEISMKYLEKGHPKRSLPLWECGLKSDRRNKRRCMYRSLPLWECGLKLEITHYMLIMEEVTPLVGVWIEIFN